MSRLPPEDRELPLHQAADRFCPRLLKPGWVKRVARAALGGTPERLMGYMVACPGCGRPGLHFNDHAVFTEVEGKLRSHANPMACSYCNREIRVSGEVIAARAPKA